MSSTRPAKRTRAASKFAVQIAVAARGVPAPALLRRWARAASSGGTEVALRIVGTAEARRLNRVFRLRDYATDVLTFAYGKRPWRADIVLCHPVIEREARERGVDLAAHYAHLVVHGMLHMRGHDHHRAREARRMEREEARILARLGYADPYGAQPGAIESSGR
jgi:probable rRNA maturation factor